jgi:hypothetical protein
MTADTGICANIGCVFEATLDIVARRVTDLASVLPARPLADA